MRPAIVFVFLLWGGGEKLLLCEGGQDVVRGSAGGGTPHNLLWTNSIDDVKTMDPSQSPGHISICL